jgi:flagellin-like protein
MQTSNHRFSDENTIAERTIFVLSDLDDPIVPATRDNKGVSDLGGTLIAIAVVVATL